MTIPTQHDAGRTRDRMMPADSGAACKTYTGRIIFDAVIDHAPGTKWRRNAEREARVICAGCPVQTACLTVHGHDLELGVVAGLTDRERKRGYGVAS